MGTDHSAVSGQSPRPEDVVLCDAGGLFRFTEQTLAAVGLRDIDARDMAAQIVGSELAGHESHGLRRLPEYVRRVREGFAAPTATATVDLDTGALVRLNGHGAFGHLVMRDATRLAIQRATDHGIAAVAVHNADFAGRLADFCEQAAAVGIATLVYVNDGGSSQDVAPPGGLEGRLATNPIAASIPRARSPHLVLDMATSSVAMGRLSEWRDRGRPIPSDWTTDQGILQPFGGIKGFGLALVAEALAGALTTAGTVSPQPAPERQGVFMVAIDVKQLRPLPDFTAEVERFTSHVKNTPLAQGHPPIKIPGENSAQNAHHRRDHGVPIQAFTWQQMQTIAHDFSLAMPRRVAR
ncbi:Ldh family oxidoreductase [Streptomyces ferrugineus]|uniref:Ldh family oxidoreductase n=1 Tax=Streptomyces ferrugineus TaxID=1413221 RepID=A0A7M2SCH5_9ACTN|nr:Ldh family oxidoreductase [Streptomyces ferrugineus]QOV33188.1 Ldh family oxidoreductase [Streptomyces ferrugineus]